MAPKLLKFDIVHPQSYLDKKKREWDDLDELTSEEYRSRLISLRSNYSDFYTYYLNQLGWEAEEFFLLDETYLDKLGRELFGLRYPAVKWNSKFWNRIRPERWGWANRVIQAYIEEFNPDVLFARSQPMASSYWQRYRKQCLLVSRLSARLPRHWHPDDWDLIYTDLAVFQKFFEAHGVPTILNRQGFDPRILSDLEKSAGNNDVVFVGGLGTQNFAKRTALFEKIAQVRDFPFKWWGYWWEHGGTGSMDDFPHLKATYQGPISGLEMYQLYRDSKIILNDYVDTSGNIGFNQRMFEIMGIGAFMLTRNAKNLSRQFPEHLFATFTDTEECIQKIAYYLSHDNERKAMSSKAEKFVAENYHYKDIIKEFDREIRKHLTQKQAELR